MSSQNLETQHTEVCNSRTKRPREPETPGMFSKIAEFTRAASQEPLPKHPRVMTSKDVETLGRFVIEELVELFDTVNERVDTNIAVLKLLAEAMLREKNDVQSQTKVEKIADQQDALIDMTYFCGDAGAKSGFQLDPSFAIVHSSNMAKIDAETGKVIRRESDGKVLKPDGWMPPNLIPEVERQLAE